MIRRTLISILALGLSVCFVPMMAHADSFKLVNKTEYELDVRASAITFYSSGTKHESFKLKKGKSKTVDFGSTHWLTTVKISTTQTDHSHEWRRMPNLIDLPQHWTVTVKIKNDEMKVEKVKN